MYHRQLHVQYRIVGNFRGQVEVNMQYMNFSLTKIIAGQV